MAEARKSSIEIEVVYALPLVQTVVNLTVPEGTTVNEAIERAGLAAKHPGLDAGEIMVGIFGRRVALSQVLGDHDRVEIYRSLVADAKQARHGRAQQRRLKARQRK